MVAGQRVRAGRSRGRGPHGAGITAALRLAIRLARDEAWSAGYAGERLARDVADRSVLRAARARVVQAWGASEALPTTHRVLESLDHALGTVPTLGVPDGTLAAS